jgi:hypothetical protein
VLPVHYSHDPEKTEEWVAGQRKAYLRDQDWNREMELDFTEVAGTRAYPQFKREIHVSLEPLLYNRFLPLCLCVDFNVGIMAWPICQIQKGKIHVIAEIALDPASVPEMVREFRNMFPVHPGELWVYGDASGSARSSQSMKSDYDMMRMAFRGYPAPMIFKVPKANPPVRERINSVCSKLMSPDGEPGVIIDPSCTNLIQDLVEVVLHDRNGGIYKSTDPSDAYSKRTHSSDAFGYCVSREWPLVHEVYRYIGEKSRKRVRPRYGRIPGSL